MRTSRKSLIKSSHDFVLIVGALIAIAIMISSIVRHWRIFPTSLGMTNAVTVADSSRANSATIQPTAGNT
jgi:hypothetical protein